MGQRESSTHEKDSTPGPAGLDAECVQTAWPAWHQSLVPRAPARGQDGGIFRGEFILLRSSPPARPDKREEGEGRVRRTDRLCVQKNRLVGPGTVPLPLPRHDPPATSTHPLPSQEDDTPHPSASEGEGHKECPSTLLQPPASRDEGDALDRFLRHKASLDALKKRHAPRHGHSSRESSLGDIREEEEEEEEEKEDLQIQVYKYRLTTWRYFPATYTCPCGGQQSAVTGRQLFNVNTTQPLLSTRGRRRSLQRGRQILKSSKITLPPVKEDQQERCQPLAEDSSSDESGLSEHEGQSEAEDKMTYVQSSGDESQHTCRPSSTSSDSALWNSDNQSSLSSEGDGTPNNQSSLSSEGDGTPRVHDGLREEEGEERNERESKRRARSGCCSSSVVTEVVVHNEGCPTHSSTGQTSDHSVSAEPSVGLY